MATIAVKTVSIDGVTVGATAAAAGGDQFLNTGREWVRFVNASGGDITVTVTAQSDCIHGELDDITIVVPAGEERYAGIFQPDVYNDINGYVQVTYSGVTSFSLRPFILPMQN